MRLLVVGAGSTGGYFGGRLAQAGRDVTFLVRPARAEILRAKGLQIVSPHGDFTLKPQLVTASELKSIYDVILLTVKAYSLDVALDELAPVIGPRTMILPVLNGIKHVDSLIGCYGKQAAVGCVCRVATTLDDEGRIVQIAKFQDLDYGEMDGSITPRMKELDSFMQGAGFDAKLSTDIAREMWEKWIYLATMGGITCLMRGTVGEIAAAEGGTNFVHQFLDEVVSVVRAVGPAPSDAFLKEVTATLTMKGSPQTSSMYRDLQKGGKIEADQIVGDLLVRGQKAGLSTPLLAAAYTNLSVYQNRLPAS
jgi:2-dehydropantoate 2-reductase